jgi:hypothetical protein
VTGIVCRRILYRYEDQYLVHLEKLLVFGGIRRGGLALQFG